MDISARTEYAVRAMLALAQAQAECRAAQRRDASPSARTCPASSSRRSWPTCAAPSLVVSTRGARGGYTLARPASEVSLGDVFRAVDGPLAEVRGLRPHETSYEGVAQHLPTVWVAVRVALREVLDDTSLADVLSGDLPAAVRAKADAPDAWRNR